MRQSSRASCRRSSLIALTLAGLLGSTLHAQVVDKPAIPSTDALILAPGDLIRIRIWPAAELGGEFQIEDTGLAYLPILGAVQVAGRSIADLRVELRKLYGESMKTPVVSIVPVMRVVVLGQVGRPGVYAVTPMETIGDVIFMAGGFTNRANRENVEIHRKNRTININGREIIESAEAASAIALASGDRIVVPSRPFVFDARRIYSALQIAVFFFSAYLTIDRVMNR